MKFKLPIALLILAIFFVGLFNIETIPNNKNLRERHAFFLKNSPINKGLKMSKKERLSQGIPPNKYMENEYLLEMNPVLGRPTHEKLFALQERLSNNKTTANRVPGDAVGNPWVERGPNNVGGRTRALLYDPNDVTHKRVFAGGVSGGLWVNNDITNANSSWTRISGISENISVSSFTVDPNNSQIFYVGTGETYVSGSVTGNGIWKSADGGTTWTHVFGGSTGVTFLNSGQTIVPGQYNINDIKAWDNGGSTVIFAAVGANFFKFTGVDPTFIGAFEYGLYKSTDGGTSWSKIILNVPLSSNSYEINDIEIAADNSIWVATKGNVFGTGAGKILKSTTGTDNSFLTRKTISGGKRVQIAVSSSNAGTLYVLAEVGTSAPISLLKTSNSFASTITLALPADADTGIPNNDFTRGQAFYDLMLEVDPTNDAIAYVGGIDLFRTEDSGSTWAQISKWSNNNVLSTLTIPLVHADMHAMAFNPADANSAIFGNDGGVYYASSLLGSLTSTTAISERNKDYNVTQFYKGAIGQSTSTEILLAGAQDNGSQFVEGTSTGVNGFTDIFGGDGAYEFIDKDNAYLIVSYVYNTYSLFPIPVTYDINGYPQGEIVIEADQNTGSFINTADLDDNLDILYADGVTGAINQVARYTDITTTPVRTNFTDPLLTGQLTAFKVSPYTTTSTSLIVGTKNGQLLKITNADTATPIWAEITGSGFVGSVSDISFGANENEIIVTFHNYGVTNIWFTTDGGTNWTSKEGDLPDLPVKAVMMNPLNNDEVIVGTDLGVWRTESFKTASPTWVQSQNGMQNSKVTSFDYRTADNTVLASTYGRGLFTGTFSSGVLAVNNFEKEKKSILVYPTVSDGKFTVTPKLAIGKTNVSIFDVRGRQVYKVVRNFNQGTSSNINVSLKAGIYILKLEAENLNYSQKIIIK
ncbi:MAG: T9SS type A sorting domain-containing protein [Flavobacteriaceae bacterium]|nr:T9SS type A sorting domain-containing protein [Flavobacteriaceae bacterium]